MLPSEKLRSIVEEIMLDVMYDIPSQKDVSKCIIDEACVTEGKEPTIIYKKKTTGTNDEPDVNRRDVG